MSWPRAIVFFLSFLAFTLTGASDYSSRDLVLKSRFKVGIKKSDLISSLISKDKLLEINQDLLQAHELSPSGVPAGYDWFKRSRLGAGNNVGTYAATTGWGQLFWVKGANESSDYLQIRNFNFLVCHGEQRKWELLQSGPIEGRQFSASYVNNTNIPAKYFDNKDGVATVSFEKDTAFHFWPSQGQVNLPSKEVCGVLVLLQARLIPEYKKTVDSRSFLIGAGADYWTKINSKWDKYRTNTDIAIGRLRLVHKEWEWYGMSTASDEDIKRLYDEGYKIGSRIK